MKRREFITLLGGAAAAWPMAASAQQPERVRRIGTLLAGLTENDPVGQLRMAQFRRGLENLGWIDGRNIEVDARWPGASAEKLRTAAVELAAKKPDLIFAGNEAAALALQQTTTTVPIVFTQAADPVAAGLVASVARPAGNITGFANYDFGIAGKWMELLRELAPRTGRVGVIYDRANAAARHLPALEGARWPGVDLVTLPVHTRAELEDALNSVANGTNGAVILLPGPLAVGHRDLVIPLTIKRRLPLIYSYSYYTTAGGLGSYGPNLLDQYRRAAGYVDRILKGEKPADLPVQFPTKYILSINLKTAKTLGLSVPLTLQASADEVIE